MALKDVIRKGDTIVFYDKQAKGNYVYKDNSLGGHLDGYVCEVTDEKIRFQRTDKSMGTWGCFYSHKSLELTFEQIDNLVSEDKVSIYLTRRGQPIELEKEIVEAK